MNNELEKIFKKQLWIHSIFAWRERGKSRKPQTKQPVPGLRFEFRTSGIRSSCTIHSIVTSENHFNVMQGNPLYPLRVSIWRPGSRKYNPYDATLFYSSLSLLTSGGCDCRWSERWFRWWRAVGSWVQEVSEPPPCVADASTSPSGWRGWPLLRILQSDRSLQVLSIQGRICF